MRIHIGEADDWTPAPSCIALAASLKASGHDAAITVYPGAYHDFDNPMTSHLRLPNVDNGAACSFRVASILGPFPSTTEIEGCLRKGATVGGNSAAIEQARTSVRAQLAELLR